MAKVYRTELCRRAAFRGLRKAKHSMIAIGVGLTALVLSNPALAKEAPTLVSDPAMCPRIAKSDDVLEMGRILDADGMYQHERYCFFQTAIEIDFQSSNTETRIGYCEEPGILTPMVFAFQMSDFGSGTVWVYEQGIEEPAIFQACPAAE